MPGTSRPPARARLGLGRSFQGATLFPDLNVRETVGLAVHGVHGWQRATRAEADEIIDFLGLGRFRDKFINELSTGTRRIVELACLMASGARVLCLDEPTAGIAQRESEAFVPLILRIRAELDASLLVIEHDMPVVMAISDRVYCLEAGRIIAAASPDEVRNDPLVIASYLGTDPQAINRSGDPAGRPRRDDPDATRRRERWPARSRKRSRASRKPGRAIDHRCASSSTAIGSVGTAVAAWSHRAMPWCGERARDHVARRRPRVASQHRATRRRGRSARRIRRGPRPRRRGSRRTAPAPPRPDGRLDR